jgi:hypothetical protein
MPTLKKFIFQPFLSIRKKIITEGAKYVATYTEKRNIQGPFSTGDIMQCR